MNKFESISHKVSIAGIVTDLHTDKPIGKVSISILQGPEDFNSYLDIKARQYVDTWDTMVERPDRTVTNTNGHYHFLDLPHGRYRISAGFGDRNTRYGKAKIEVDVKDPDDEKSRYSEANIQLPSTSVRGVITDRSTGDPVIFAEISLLGSAVTAISNLKGEYLLNCIETTGDRPGDIQVAAKGYRLASESVQLREPGSVKTINFSIEPF